MRRVATLVLLLIPALSIGAFQKLFFGPGNFSDNTKWNGNKLPVAGDSLSIRGTCTFDNGASNLVRLLLRAALVDNDISTVLGKGDRERPSNATTCSSYNCNLSRKFHHLRLLYLFCITANSKVTFSFLNFL